MYTKYVDVKVAVASCIGEITRVTAPDSAYENDQGGVLRDMLHTSYANCTIVTEKGILSRSLHVHFHSHRLQPKHVFKKEACWTISNINAGSKEQIQDTNRWEFANEGFIKDQKHLLMSTNRKKPSQVILQHISTKPKMINATPHEGNQYVPTEETIRRAKALKEDEGIGTFRERLLNGKVIYFVAFTYRHPMFGMWHVNLEHRENAIDS
ncbi:heat shock factor-type, DNA-binding protein [Tanacetum coccineum]